MKQDTPLREQCRNRWSEIHLALGLPSSALSGKHGPCPMCGGRDRFRYDRNETGSFFCSQCSNGDGFTLLQKFHKTDFADIARRIKGVIGTLPPPKAVSKVSDEVLKERVVATWKEGLPVTYGDPVSQYLESRGIRLDSYPDALRYHPSLRYDRQRSFPAMLAKVTDASGKGVNVHRTYLSGDEVGKAPVDQPKKMMPGKVPHGSAIRLSNPLADVLGIAEGVETAAACSILWNIPVWSAIDAAHLLSWEPPPVTKCVYVFCDNDANYVGQSAGYGLANRLVIKNKLTVRVEIPECEGEDWNDALRRG